jgi:hypothetical protein
MLSVKAVERALLALDRVSTVKVPDFWTSMEHSTIRTQAGIKQFEPFGWQKQWVEGATRKEIILKSRDVGSSEICVRFFTYKLLCDGGNFVIKADKWDSARNLVAIARQYLQSLPADERPEITKDNQDEIEVAGKGTIRAMAQGGGRSERCRYLLMTERAFWDKPEEELAAVSGALVADGWLIVESTANGFNEFYNLWTDSDQLGYRRTFIPWSANPSHDAAWRRDKEVELASTPHKLAQEYPATSAQAFIGSGLCRFDQDAIGELRGESRAPVSSSDNGQILVWKEPVKGVRYVVGADVAEGKAASRLDLDASSAAVYSELGEHVASIHGRMPLDKYAEMLHRVGSLYNRALLNVERNNHGHAVLLSLASRGYPNIYYHVDPLAESVGRVQEAQPGYPTSHKGKALLEEILAKHIYERTIASPDDAFWAECLTYVYKGNGTASAQGSCHDDRVIAHALATFALTRLPFKMAHAVGLSPVGMSAPSDRPEPSLARSARERRQKRIKAQIDAGRTTTLQSVMVGRTMKRDVSS